MNKSDEKLLNRLLEGDCSEVELEHLTQRIQSDMAFKKEVLQQIQIHASLEQKFNVDPLGSKLHKSISSLNLDKSESMSARIMPHLQPKLKSKPKSKNTLIKTLIPVAAIFCFAIAFWKINSASVGLVEPAKIKIMNHNNVVKTIDKEEGVIYKLKDDEKAEYVSASGVKVQLFPNSEFHVKDNQFYLHNGYLLADIQKRDGLKALEFITGAQKTIITGTQFGLHHKERNGKNDYLLQLTEGSIDFYFYKANKTTASVKANEFLYVSGSEGLLHHGNLKDFEPEGFDDKRVHISPKNYKWIPFFWSNWTPDRVKISDKKTSLVLSAGSNETTTLSSEVVKTYFQTLNYEINMKAFLNHGSADVGLKCYYKGQYAYEDTFSLKRNGSKITIDVVEFRKGERKTTRSAELPLDLPIFTLTGNIHHNAIIVSKKDLSVFDKDQPISESTTDVIEDVVFELYVKAYDNTDAHLNINSMKVIRDK